jgi:hypothetical protein
MLVVAAAQAPRSREYNSQTFTAEAPQYGSMSCPPLGIVDPSFGTAVSSGLSLARLDVGPPPVSTCWKEPRPLRDRLTNWLFTRNPSLLSSITRFDWSGVLIPRVNCAIHILRVNCVPIVEAALVDIDKYWGIPAAHAWCTICRCFDNLGFPMSRENPRLACASRFLPSIIESTHSTLGLRWWVDLQTSFDLLQ